ncbi:MAG: lipopolysaccharide kinase InaA family protein [Tannerellaceae bacterium]|jgi:serine/threonine protein kinase|nr:lipopolysaccharide kinase InaA family protein [Tannerellaceae bacterium]
MSVVIYPSYNYKEFNHFVRNLPARFAEEGESFYKERNEVKLFYVGDRKIVVKSFKVPHCLNRLAYTFFRSSKARRSYDYSLEIIARGFHAPAPIAYIETFEMGLLKNSYYISEYTGGVTMRKEFSFIYPYTKEKTATLLAFAAFTARLHDAGIYHRDYSNGNILYTKKENEAFHFELVDVNRVQFCRVNWEKGCKSFRRLDMSVEMLRTVATEYARLRNLDMGKTITQIIACNLKTMKPYTSFDL